MRQIAFFKEKKKENLENRNANMRKVTNPHGQELMCFTLLLLTLEKRQSHCMRSTVVKKGCHDFSRWRAERKEEDGNRRHWPRKSLPPWPGRLPSASSSSSSCCASADCYQPHTSPSIRVRARAKRSACRQPIGQDGTGRRLLANGHPDAPDVTRSALSVLCARQARGRSESSKTR